MAKLTICPHYLTDYNLTTPTDVEQQIVVPLVKCFVKAISENVEIVLSKDILIKHALNFPWNRSDDPVWTGYLREWNATITMYLGKATIIDVPDVVSRSSNNCSNVHTDTKDLFSKFLEIFGSGGMHGGQNEESIFLEENCNYPSEWNLFYFLTNLENFNYVVYPWLRVYLKSLPPAGDFRFVPPSDWRSHPRPTRASYHPYGYVDDSGNVWEWDHYHGDHWDVQHSVGRGNYTNVNLEGRILSTR